MADARDLHEHGLAHDLRNQLGTMLLNAQLLQEDLAAPDAPAAAAALVEAIRHARGLAEGLFAQASAAPTTTVDLAAVAARACAVYRPVLGKGGIRLSTHLQRAPARAAEADVLRILSNLLENARVAHRCDHVIVQTGPGEICVQNSGTGIPPHVELRLFEPGHGLGHSLWLARRMGGDLALIRAHPVRFVLSLPLPGTPQVPVAAGTPEVTGTGGTPG